VASHWAIYRGSGNEPIAILESNNNITDLKNAEEALQEAKNQLAAHTEELEQRIARRTAELQRSLNDMESFCYTIAHDLRAPLRAMSGFSHSLAEDYASQLDQIGHNYCERISAAANRMNQLISDLLVYGRLTHSELPSQSVDLTDAVEKVLGHAAPQIEERHAEVDVDKPLPKVCGDPPVIDQVIENLITNAIKFVPPERQPRIHVYARHHHDNIRLCVEDNGIGIPHEHRRKIFRPFERLQPAKDYPGTGIGLAIVQRGIEKMGGRVGVKSAPEQGSCFWVELPERCGRKS
jgi:signal transduction histidine kinase